MIPDEAVEAAAKALRDKYALEVCELPISSFLGDARTALEAAAPHMLAPVWLEGYREGAMYGALGANGHEPPNQRNPYRS